MNQPAHETPRLGAPAHVKHDGLLAWVAEIAALTEPAAIHWCDGSDAEYEALIEQLIAAGTLQRAAEEVASSLELQWVAPVVAARAEYAWLQAEDGAVRGLVADALAWAQRADHPWFAGELAFWSQLAGAPFPPPARMAEPHRLMLTGAPAGPRRPGPNSAGPTTGPSPWPAPAPSRTRWRRSPCWTAWAPAGRRGGCAGTCAAAASGCRSDRCGSDDRAGSEVSTSNGATRSWSSTARVRTRARAAASSIASGSPSSRTQMRVTSSAVASSRPSSAPRAFARS